MNETPETITWSLARSALGHILLAHTRRGVCLVLPGDSEVCLRNTVSRFLPAHRLREQCLADSNWHLRLLDWIESPGEKLHVPLDVTGTPFQRRVFEALGMIPPGQTRSYQAIAEQLGMPGGSRAVAGACAANRLALLIPCHRVIRSDGSLGGYRWGMAWKQALLERERAFIEGEAG